ncbi:MAG TPA: PilZ domain-containing protein [Terriglobales bacterium]
MKRNLMDSAAKPAFSVSRQHPRIQLEVRVLVLRKHKDERVFGRSADVSLTGLSVYIPQKLVIEEPVTVEFSLEQNGNPMTLHASVRSQNGYRYGFEIFTNSEQYAEFERACRLLACSF